MSGSDVSSLPPQTPCYIHDRPEGQQGEEETMTTLNTGGPSALALHTHSDLCVGSPVRRGHLVSEPGCDRFSGTGAVLRHRLDHKAHPIQDPLSSVLMVGQERVRLREETKQ